VPKTVVAAFLEKTRERTFMKWVTREHANVERVACPWLIKRFIDPEAEFEFVPSDTDPTTITDGIPFDMKGVELGHHQGRCSFESFLRAG
jgi:hypothetical protein